MSPLLRDHPFVFVGGQWTPPRHGGVLDVLSPASEEVIGRIGEATADDVDAAVDSAYASFEQGAWRTAPPHERAGVLRDTAKRLEDRAPELVDLLTAELGCPRWYAERFHIPNPIRHLRYYADLIEEFGWLQRRTDAGGNSLVVHEPVGVVGTITPWNGPLSSPMLKIAPALAAGCSVVSKPAPEAPLSLIALADALRDCGLPDGVFNVVPGGRDVGARLVEHPAVNKIAFTGSTVAGKQVMAACAGTVKRVTLELGGKSAAIVLDDADIEVLAAKLPPMLLNLSGQACIAQSRVLVPRSRADEMTRALADAVANTPVGDPFEPTTIVGPLVSATQRERVEGYLASARDDGASVVVGGGRPEHLERGYYVEPTLLADVTPSMRVAREEIFGPVMSVLTYDMVDEAIRIANDSVYGLAGSVWTGDQSRGVEIAREMRTGMVSINGAPQAWCAPFGGFKQSGLGREMGPEGLRLYTELKTIAVVESA
jgi:betaine-aldehyde dehydrogenase